MESERFALFAGGLLRNIRGRHGALHAHFGGLMRLAMEQKGQYPIKPVNAMSVPEIRKGTVSIDRRNE